MSKESATVQVKTKVRNEGAGAAACTLSSAVIDKDGKVVQTAEASQQIGPNGDYEFVQQLSLDKPSLWSVSAPAMYTLRTTVRVGQGVADVYETPFGVREAVFDADKGFLDQNDAPVRPPQSSLHFRRGQGSGSSPGKREASNDT